MKLKMPIRNSTLIVFFVFSLSCSRGANQETVAVEGGAPGDVLAQLRPAWISVHNVADAAALTAFFAEDGVILPPQSRPLSGKTAIQGYLEGDLSNDVSLEIVECEVRRAGDLAVERADYKVTIGTGTDVSIRTGKYVMLWQKDASGKWKIVWDIWNSD